MDGERKEERGSNPCKRREDVRSSYVSIVVHRLG